MPIIRRYKVEFVLWILSGIVLAAIGTEAWLSHRNTLNANGRWTVTKAGIRRVPADGLLFLLTRQTLARNRLNLGAWRTHQEVLFNQPLDLQEIRFDLFLKKDAWACLLFNKKAAGFEGIRLSSDPRFSTMYFKASSPGQFLSRKPIGVDWVDSGAWHRVRLVCQANGKSLDLSIDGISHGSIPTALHDAAQVGFRGGSAPAMIDNVRLRPKGGATVLREDFRNRTGRTRVFLVLLIAVAGITYLIRLRKGHGRQILLGMIAFNLICTGCAAMLFAVDYYLLSGRYPDVNTQLIEIFEKGAQSKDTDPSVRQLLEKSLDVLVAEAEHGTLGPDPNYFLRVLKDNYAFEPRPEVNRILFLGTSQTHGEGVSEEEETFVWQTQKRLNEQRHADEKPFECINGALPATKARGVLTRYRSDMIRLAPDMCIINLCINDAGEPTTDYITDLEVFVAINREKGIATVFSLEAESTKCSSDSPPLTYQYMRDVAKKHRIPLLDFQGFMCDNYDKGFLWWDEVHMAAYGQVLAAQYFSRQIRDLVSMNQKNGS